MSIKINVNFDKKQLTNLGLSIHLRRCIRNALLIQGVDFPCEINVLITDNEGIRAINAATRKIDSPTDVLSFPMFQLTPGRVPVDWPVFIDPETQTVPLGDMVISLERAMEQAVEFGHGIKRETGYLAVHSVLHLLGYDHLDEGPMKEQMRKQEKLIMEMLKLSR